MLATPTYIFHLLVSYATEEWAAFLFHHNKYATNFYTSSHFESHEPFFLVVLIFFTLLEGVGGFFLFGVTPSAYHRYK